MDYQKACRALKIAEAVLTKSYTKYFLCFGNLLHLIRDRTIEPDKDIDIGVFYEQADTDAIVRGFEQWQYVPSSRIENDIDHKTFNISFKHKGNEELPPIDIFFWFLHDKIRYHTYDILQEKKKYPSQYVFKGVPAKLLPDPNKQARDDTNIAKSFFGKWNQPYFQFELPIPLMYGSLLDIWYPNWLKPQKMESMTPYVVKMKSCESWTDRTHIACQLADSKIDYESKRKAL